VIVYLLSHVDSCDYTHRQTVPYICMSQVERS